MKPHFQMHHTECIDTILRYFMEAILQVQQNKLAHTRTSPTAGLPLQNPLEEDPFRSFLDFAMKLILQSEPPEVARLLLEAEYTAYTCGKEISAEDALCFQLIKECSWHFYYSDDFYTYLLVLKSFWSDSLCDYVEREFFPRLPEPIRKKYKIFPSPPPQP